MAVGKKLSEIPKYKESFIWLLKFTDHIDSLVRGNLHMNNLQYYIDLEKKTRIRGRGDKFEASQVYTGVQMEMYNGETDELIGTGTSESASILVEENAKTPVFCLFAITAQDLRIVGENETHYITELDFPTEELEKMISEFSEKVVKIIPLEFFNRVTKTFKEKGYTYKTQLVKYDDYSINSSERMDSYQNNSNEVVFWKEDCFKHQNEYRIAIKNRKIDEAIDVNIGDISDITEVLDARDLLDGYKFGISK
ncbi:hypothetical protein ABEY63_26450 [Priestia aryabhattai]|uniref:hypothetical protein n=1 Tax=Priestia aryabhattai TaxID=412384 RepID=UPI003D2D3A3B